MATLAMKDCVDEAKALLESTAVEREESLPSLHPPLKTAPSNSRDRSPIEKRRELMGVASKNTLSVHFLLPR